MATEFINYQAQNIGTTKYHMIDGAVDDGTTNPTGLTGLQYNQQAADVDYLTATVSFQYLVYDFASVGSSTTRVTTT